MHLLVKIDEDWDFISDAGEGEAELSAISSIEIGSNVPEFVRQNIYRVFANSYRNFGVCT